MIPLFKAHVPASVLPRLAETFESGCLADGERVRAFEELLRGYLGNPHLVTCSEVSSALVLALYLAGVRPGDDVLSTPMTCLSLNQPVLNLFARVVWCDIEAETGNIAAASIARSVTPRSKAVLVPHWAGDPADLAAIRRVAEEHGLKVIEDAGEALGAEYGGRMLGNTGSFATAFSFHAIRHLTTGEGAAVAFADAAVAERARWMKRYSIHQPSFRDAWGEIDPASDIPECGYNSYLNSIAATIGIEQMKRLPGVLARHRENSDWLARNLSGVDGLALTRLLPDARSACWVFTVLVERRDDLLRALRERGVYASRLHLRNDRYSCFQAAPHVDLPGVESFSARALVLPCGWWVTDEDRERIAEAVRRGW